MIGSSYYLCKSKSKLLLFMKKSNHKSNEKNKRENK